MWLKDAAMNHFDIAQGFIEQCQAGTPVQVLAAAFQRSVETLGFRHFACCSHVDPLKPPKRAVMLHTYPHEWAKIFSELAFYDVDPVFLHASRSLVPFLWDTKAFHAELSPPQQEIFQEARRYGLTRGYTVPIHSVKEPREFQASCSVVPDSERIEPSAYSAVQLMTFFMYDVASKDAEAKEPPTLSKPLSRRERQCLELAAQGKSDWASAKILGLSERTVHNHVESAKRRFKVATRVQAVVHALAVRQIELGDVVRCEASKTAMLERASARSVSALKSRTKNAN
jgi:DNA-binding CsgD family transcriptional regulator